MITFNRKRKVLLASAYLSNRDSDRPTCGLLCAISDDLYDGANQKLAHAYEDNRLDEAIRRFLESIVASSMYEPHRHSVSSATDKRDRLYIGRRSSLPAVYRPPWRRAGERVYIGKRS